MEKPVSVILERIASAGKAYEQGRLGSRDALVELGRDLVGALEIPSEFLQRTFWAEVSQPAGVLIEERSSAEQLAASFVSSLQARRSSKAVPTSERCWQRWH